MSMEQSGGEVAPARRAKAPDDAGGGDLLSALPDGVLVLILLCLETEEAARTSVLSRRWRRVWTLLPELCFRSVHHPGSDCLRSILSASEVPLRDLSVAEPDASPQSLAAWLPAAARRVSGELFLVNMVSRRRRREEEEAEASQRATFELPCFDKATSIRLNLGLLGLTVPPAGVFARLTDLELTDLWFHGPGELGDAVSSPRCPCLQKLTVYDVWGLDSFTIHSQSLERLDLKYVCGRGLRQVTVVAPVLKDLMMYSCFLASKCQPVVNISAPQLKLLRWWDAYDPSSVHLGTMEHLQTLDTFFFVYGSYLGPSLTYNRACLTLLPQFRAIEHLCLSLRALVPGVNNLQYLMEDMTMLPDVTTLLLHVTSRGHSFGACSFHVLRICSGIKRLMLDLSSCLEVEVQTVCSSDCICDQPTNWKTEELLLNHLQELEIEGFGGSEHEIAFVKPLLNWMTVLKTMTITFNRLVTETKAKELFQMFKSFSKPSVCMNFYICQELCKVPYAPED